MINFAGNMNNISPTPSSTMEVPNTALHNSARQFLNESGTKSLATFGEFTVSQNFQVALVLIVSILTTVGNIFLLVASFAFSSSYSGGSKKKSRKTSVIDLLVASISAVTLARVTLRGYIQVMCIMRGYWSFGEPFCQVQAFVDSILRHLFLWYLAVLTLERYTKYIRCHDYAVTFSSLNVKVILPGLFFMITAQATGPIYGWGEYRYLTETGSCDLSLTAKFSWSYLAYTLTSLTVPPLVILPVVWFLVVANRKRNELQKSDGIVEPADKESHSGKSRFLDQRREIPIFFILVIGVVILSSPRIIVEAIAVANLLSPASSAHFLFTTHFIESIAGLYYSVILLVGHKVPMKTRRLLISKDWTVTHMVEPE